MSCLAACVFLRFNSKYRFYSVILFLSVSRDFKMEDGRAEIPLNVTVQGDVLVVIYHARSTLGGRLQAKVQAQTSVTSLLTFEELLTVLLI